MVAFWGFGLVESTAATVKLKAPGAVGRPYKVPVVVSANPSGSAPAARLKLYGATPPTAERVCEYKVLVVPLCNVGVEMANAEEERIVNPFVVLCGVGALASVTCAVK